MGRRFSLDDVDRSIESAALQLPDASQRLDIFYSNVLLGVNGKAPREHYWDADSDQQFVGLLLWRAYAMLDMANSFWTSLTNARPRKIDESTVALMKDFAERCNSLYDEAIEVQTKLEYGGRLGLPQLESYELPVPSLDAGEQIQPLWAALLSLADTVQVDWGGRVLQYRLPYRFRAARQAVESVFEPEKAVIEADKQRVLMTNRDDLAAMRRVVTDGIQKHAADLWRLGQIIWAPALMDTVLPGRPYSSHLNDKPGFKELQQELGFDLWCLTDPAKRREMQSRPDAEQQLAKLWEENIDPRATLQMALAIDEQLKQGRIRRRTGKAYNYCPWASQFLVHDPVTLGGKQFVPGELVVLYVGKDADGKFIAEVRKSGRLTNILDLLGAHK